MSGVDVEAADFDGIPVRLLQEELTSITAPAHYPFAGLQGTDASGCPTPNRRYGQFMRIPDDEPLAIG